MKTESKNNQFIQTTESKKCMQLIPGITSCCKDKYPVICEKLQNYVNSPM